MISIHSNFGFMLTKSKYIVWRQAGGKDPLLSDDSKTRRRFSTEPSWREIVGASVRPSLSLCLSLLAGLIISLRSVSVAVSTGIHTIHCILLLPVFRRHRNYHGHSRLVAGGYCPDWVWWLDAGAGTFFFGTDDVCCLLYGRCDWYSAFVDWW
jgi:hypothetical protein